MQPNVLEFSPSSDSKCYLNQRMKFRYFRSPRKFASKLGTDKTHCSKPRPRTLWKKPQNTKPGFSRVGSLSVSGLNSNTNTTIPQDIPHCMSVTDDHVNNLHENSIVNVTPSHKPAALSTTPRDNFIACDVLLESYHRANTTFPQNTKQPKVARRKAPRKRNKIWSRRELFKCFPKQGGYSDSKFSMMLQKCATRVLKRIASNLHIEPTNSLLSSGNDTTHSHSVEQDLGASDNHLEFSTTSAQITVSEKQGTSECVSSNETVTSLSIPNVSTSQMIHHIPAVSNTSDQFGIQTSSNTAATTFQSSPAETMEEQIYGIIRQSTTIQIVSKIMHNTILPAASKDGPRTLVSQIPNTTVVSESIPADLKNVQHKELFTNASLHAPVRDKELDDENVQDEHLTFRNQCLQAQESHLQLVQTNRSESMESYNKINKEHDKENIRDQNLIFSLKERADQPFENKGLFNSWEHWWQKWNTLKNSASLEEIRMKPNFYRCMSRDCAFTTMSSINFEEHVSNNHPVEMHSCSYCLQSYTDVKSLISHSEAHTALGYQCAKCVYRGSSSAHVLFHWKRMHASSEFQKAWKCPWATEPKIEISEKHIIPFCCAVCGFETKNVQKFFFHQENHPSTTCWYCKCNVTSFDALLQHLKVHGINNFHCYFCSFGDDIADAVMEHVSLNHPEKSIQLNSRREVDVHNGVLQMITLIAAGALESDNLEVCSIPVTPIAPDVKVDELAIEVPKVLLSQSVNITSSALNATPLVPSNKPRNSRTELRDIKTKSHELVRSSNKRRLVEVSSVPEVDTISSESKRVPQPSPEKACLIVKCQTCSYTFHSKKELTKHIKLFHKPSTIHICIKCNKLFGSQYLMSKHVHETHSGTKETDYLCVFCGYMSSTSKDMIEHLRVEIVGKYKCPICGFKSATTKNVSYHFKVFHSKFTPKVPILLPKAQPMVTKWIKKYVKAQSKKLQLAPTKMHPNPNPKTCPMCLKEFSSANSLEEHLCVHLQYKPYMCGCCKKFFLSFYDAVNYNHKRNGVQALHCFPETYIDRWILQVVHGSDSAKWPVWFCGSCQFQDSIPSIVVKHTRSVHPNESLDIRLRPPEVENGKLCNSVEPTMKQNTPADLLESKCDKENVSSKHSSARQDAGPLEDNSELISETSLPPNNAQVCMEQLQTSDCVTSGTEISSGDESDTNDVRLKCSDCAFETQHRKALKEHYTLKHHSSGRKFETPCLVNSESSDITMRCSMCQFQTKLLNAFKEHYRLEHRSNECKIRNLKTNELSIFKSDSNVMNIQCSPKLINTLKERYTPEHSSSECTSREFETNESGVCESNQSNATNFQCSAKKHITLECSFNKSDLSLPPLSPEITEGANQAVHPEMLKDASSPQQEDVCPLANIRQEKLECASESLTESHDVNEVISNCESEVHLYLETSSSSSDCNEPFTCVKSKLEQNLQSSVPEALQLSRINENSAQKLTSFRASNIFIGECNAGSSSHRNVTLEDEDLQRCSSVAMQSDSENSLSSECDEVIDIMELRKVNFLNAFAKQCLEMDH